MMEFVDYEHLEDQLEELKKLFQQNSPFPHLSIDGLLKKQLIDEVVSHFPKEDSPILQSFKYFNVQGLTSVGIKSLPKIYQKLIHELHSPKFIHFLEELTGIQSLQGDVELVGGGLELGTPGAYSAVHTDPSLHPHRRDLASKLTLLLYLSDPWQTNYGGQLELWDSEKKGPVKSYVPIKNRCLLFANSERAYHGYPKPICQPQGLYRRAILLWYYVADSKAEFRPICYLPSRPGTMNKILTSLENALIWAYSFLRISLKVSDQFMASLNKFITTQKWLKRKT